MTDVSLLECLKCYEEVHQNFSQRSEKAQQSKVKQSNANPPLPTSNHLAPSSSSPSYAISTSLLELLCEPLLIRFLYTSPLAQAIIQQISVESHSPFALFLPAILDSLRVRPGRKRVPPGDWESPMTGPRPVVDDCRRFLDTSRDLEVCSATAAVRFSGREPRAPDREWDLVSLRIPRGAAGRWTRAEVLLLSR